jgi:hypothetical protein
MRIIGADDPHLGGSISLTYKIEFLIVQSGTNNVLSNVHCIPAWLPLSSLAGVVSGTVIIFNDDLLLYFGTKAFFQFFMIDIGMFNFLYVRKHFDRNG